MYGNLKKAREWTGSCNGADRKGNNTQMNRYEFIEKLRAALTGKTTQSVINENVRYYEEYLDTEIRKGKDEEEVVAGLGDPRLLAKTIIEAGRRAGQSAYSFQAVDDVVDFSEEEGERGIRINGKQYRLPVWGMVLAVLFAIVTVVAVIGVMLSVLLPIVLPLLLLLMAVQIVAVLLRKK